ncbi:MAG: 3-hydroxy-acyl-CoA dehydrogenase [Candidatus Methanolliviera sp. GoM_asphalt]|nr:MAG: 3-hydroxy-acyl-CoA dehydrogenase [Candidatus Methanolliviera sp. GoM_asphalt]
MIKKVGVVGTGAMGIGVSQVVARAGLEILIRSRAKARARKAVEIIEGNLQGLASSGKISQEEVDGALARTSGTAELTDLDRCDIIVECVAENYRVKKQLFGELDKLCPKHAILASNTSSLSITELASSTEKPEKFVGMHFFNPVQVMKLVEIVRGVKTSEETMYRAKELAKKLGRTPIEVKDNPGFIVNNLNSASFREYV